MKKLLKLVFLLGLSFHSYGQIDDQEVKIAEPHSKRAQNSRDIRLPIIKAIGRSIDSYQLHKLPENTAFVFTIGISFNSKGRIDSIYFSKKASESIKKIIRPDNNLAELIKQINTSELSYNNEILLLPILFIRRNDTSILNVNNFLMDFENMWPEFEGISTTKPLVLLKPYVNVYYNAQY